MKSYRMYASSINDRYIDEIVETLRRGGVVVYPTDSTYAIGCDALSNRAVERVCRMRGINPAKQRLSMVCADISQASDFASIDNKAFRLLRDNLPGPFTFILPTTSSLPKIYKNRKTVGIRVPDNPIIREIVSMLGNPVLNASVKDEHDEIEYTTDPELIHEKWGDVADIVIDGGFGGIEPSTVVDCTSDEPEIVRQGKGVLNV